MSAQPKQNTRGKHQAKSLKSRRFVYECSIRFNGSPQRHLFIKKISLDSQTFPGAVLRDLSAGILLHFVRTRSMNVVSVYFFVFGRTFHCCANLFPITVGSKFAEKECDRRASNCLCCPTTKCSCKPSCNYLG